MERSFRRYGVAVVRFRNVIVLAAVLITIVLGLRIPTLRLDNRTRVWVPSGDPLVGTTRDIQRMFGIRNAVIIGIVPDRGGVFQRPVLQKVRAIQRGLAQLPEAVPQDVLSLAARKVRVIRGTVSGMVVQRLMRRVPTDVAGLRRVRRRFFSSPLYQGLLVSHSAKAAAVVAAFRLSPAHPSYLALYRKIRRIAATGPRSGIRTYIGGAPTWAASLERNMNRMPIYFMLAFLVMMAIQYAAFRSLQGAVLPMMTALIGTVWALGFMALAGIPMDVLTSVTPILIMAVGTGHSTQMLKRYYEEVAAESSGRAGKVPPALRQRAVVAFLVKSGPVMVTAGMIAVVAFLSLATADIAMVRHFGILAAIGIACVLVLEMTLMPALRAMLPLSVPASRLRPSRIDVLFERLAGALAGGRAPAVLAFLLVVAGIIGLGMFRLRVDNDPKNYFPRDSAVRRDNRMLNQTFAGTGSVFFLVHGQRPGAVKDPAVLRGMRRFQQFLDRRRGIGKTQSIADFVAQMNQAMHAGRVSYDRIPTHRALVAQYLFLYGASGDPDDFDNLVDSDYQNAVIWAFARDDSTAFVERLYRRSLPQIHRDFPPTVQVSLGGGLAETLAINRAVVHEKIENLVQMALIVFLAASLVLRSWMGGLFVALPLGLIVLVNFGIMGWIGMPLNMGTATTASLAISIGADYELYLLFRFREAFARSGDLRAALAESLQTSGKAVAFVTAAIIGGYSVLFLARFGFYTDLAAMVIVTMTASLVFATVFLRAMTVLFRPRFLFGTRPPGAVRPPIT